MKTKLLAVGAAALIILGKFIAAGGDDVARVLSKGDDIVAAGKAIGSSGDEVASGLKTFSGSVDEVAGAAKATNPGLADEVLENAESASRADGLLDNVVEEAVMQGAEQSLEDE